VVNEQQVQDFLAGFGSLGGSPIPGTAWRVNIFGIRKEFEAISAANLEKSRTMQKV
jgi:hypothetical protein